MKIGLNGQRLSVSDPAGPELYTKNLYEALARVDSNNEYTVYTDSSIDNVITSINQPNFKYKCLESCCSWTQESLAGELLKNPVDIFFTPVHTLPLIRNGDKTKFVSMIHGLEYKYVPSKGLLNKLLRGRHEWYVAKYSDAIIVPSQFTKSEILRQNWGVKEDKITVVPEGVGEEFYKRSAEEIEDVRKKYELGHDNYLIFISTIQPRKNLPKLVEGFSKFLKETGREDVKLFVVGKKGWDFEDSMEAPKKHGIADKVTFVGRVPQKDLPALLSGAGAFVSTSLEEGFGLPLIEAMYSEVPAIVSDIKAFRETADDSVWFVNPDDAECIKDKISRLFAGEYPKQLIDSAKLRAENYSWKNAASKTLEVFNKLYTL